MTIKSSKKRSLQSKKRRIINTSKKSMIKTFLKKINSLIYKEDKDSSVKLFKLFQSILDKQAIKGLIHKNKSARYKSSLMKKIKNIKN